MTLAIGWQIMIYLAVIAVLVLRLLPTLLTAMLWDTDFPEYGRWFSREYYE